MTSSHVKIAVTMISIILSIPAFSPVGSSLGDSTVSRIVENTMSKRIKLSNY